MKSARLALVLILFFSATPTIALCQEKESEKDFLSMHLNKQQAAELEKRLEKEPGDITARGELLGYYMMRSFEDKAASRAKARHILWIIENRPESKIAGMSFMELIPGLDGDEYYEAKLLWKKKVEENPNSIKILANAAAYSMVSDREYARGLVKKLRELEPANPEWKEQMDQLDQMDAMFAGTEAKMAQGEDKKTKTADALKRMETTAGPDCSEENRFYMLGDMAELAFLSGDTKKASEYSEELLSIAPHYQDNWNYGNAIHEANTTLGRIALVKGDIEQAKQRLVLSAKVKGSPQLDSFGPSMDLAKELLLKGEKDAVITYLNLCKSFWENDYGAVKKWIHEIRESGTSGLE